jgi:hypothetical protein
MYSVPEASGKCADSPEVARGLTYLDDMVSAEIAAAAVSEDGDEGGSTAEL